MNDVTININKLRIENGLEPLPGLDDDLIPKKAAITLTIGMKPWFKSFVEGMKLATEYCKEHSVPPEVMEKAVRAAVHTAIKDAVEVSRPLTKKEVE